MEFPSKDRQADFASQRQRSQPDLGSAAEGISQAFAVMIAIAKKSKGAAGSTAAPASPSLGKDLVGLLDRGEHPVAAARPHEGPHLGCFGALFAAADQTAGCVF